MSAWSENNRQLHTYTFSKFVTNLVQVVLGEECLFAPLSHPRVVGFNIMQWEDSSDILPLAVIGSNSGAALFLAVSNHLVNDPQALSLGLSLGRVGRSRFGIADTVKPVANTANKDDVSIQTLSISTSQRTYRDR